MLMIEREVYLQKAQSYLSASENHEKLVCAIKKRCRTDLTEASNMDIGILYSTDI